jgi:predicted HicB family RNase H-like nuclease
MKTMTYKGYAARIEYSEEDGCFVGHLAGIRDIVGFDGESVAEMTMRFHRAVDDYLGACAELGQEPNKPEDHFLERAARGRGRTQEGLALLRKAGGD